MRSLLLASLLALGCTADTGNTPADMTTVFPPGPDMAGGPCTDGVLNNDETDVDCGGACGPCDTGKDCKLGKDCQSGSCTNRACDAPSCSDAIKNGKETDVDCGGGTCPGCDNGKPCTDGTDCKSMTCKNATCAPSPCSNGVKDGMETDVDCGGPTCAKCKDGQMCSDGTDCVGAICNNAVCKSPINCMAGTANCDGNAANGCEVNTNTDAKNCGGCGKACANNAPNCVGGKCIALPATCRIVNGIRWCFDTKCGVPCAQTCADLGLPLTMSDADWFAAQDSQQECQAIADGFGVKQGTLLQGKIYTCLESASANEVEGGPLVGPILCTSFNGCPMNLRTDMDLKGVACGAGGAHAVCPCQ